MSKRAALRGRHGRCAAAVCATSLFTLLSAGAWSFAQTGGAAAQAPSCQGDNGGITLPSGFCATVFADNLGTSATWWWRRTARSMSTPGVAATTITPPRRLVAF